MAASMFFMFEILLNPSTVLYPYVLFLAVSRSWVNLDGIIGFLKPQSIDLTTTPGLHLRIIEEPLTLQHLADTLDSLIRLYVKLWLLEHQRFDDFVRYSAERDRSLEAEVPLPIGFFLHIPPKRCTRFGGICKKTQASTLPLDWNGLLEGPYKRLYARFHAFLQPAFASPALPQLACEAAL
jgi:hypothetical protein